MNEIMEQEAEDMPQPSGINFYSREAEYLRKVKESDGFDIEGLIAPHGVTALVPYYFQGKYLYPDLPLVKRYAMLGLHRYNMLKRTNFELCALIKFNRTTKLFNSYFITLTARDKDSTQKTFQVEVDETRYGLLDVICSISRVKGDTTNLHFTHLDRGARHDYELPDWPADFNDRDRFYVVEGLDADWIRMYVELAVLTHDRFISNEDHLSKSKIVKVAIETTNANTKTVYIAFKGLAIRGTDEHAEHKAIVKRVLNERGILFLHGHLCKRGDDSSTLISLQEYCDKQVERLHAGFDPRTEGLEEEEEEDLTRKAWEERKHYFEEDSTRPIMSWEEVCKQRGVDPYPCWNSTRPFPSC